MIAPLSILAASRTGSASPWPKKMLSPRIRQTGFPRDEIAADDEGVGQPARLGLNLIGERQAPGPAVPEEVSKGRKGLGRRDDQDLPDPGQHERRERVVDHRLVVHRQELLAHARRQGAKASAAPAAQDDPFHVRSSFRVPRYANLSQRLRPRPTFTWDLRSPIRSGTDRSRRGRSRSRENPDAPPVTRAPSALRDPPNAHSGTPSRVIHSHPGLSRLDVRLRGAPVGSGRGLGFSLADRPQPSRGSPMVSFFEDSAEAAAKSRPVGHPACRAQALPLSALDRPSSAWARRSDELAERSGRSEDSLYLSTSPTSPMTRGGRQESVPRLRNGPPCLG